MERLTERTADGILVKENHIENGLRTFYQCFGGKPNANYSNCEEGYCAMEKLAAYEDAEEQGLHLRLPVNKDTPCIPLSIAAEGTGTIDLGCVSEDFVRTAMIRHITYAKVQQSIAVSVKFKNRYFLPARKPKLS